MVKYLVTGGCGFIGSHLVDKLLAQGDQVCILDNLVNSSPQYVPPQAELLVGSITDDTLLKQALQGMAGIFHLAAMVSVTDSVMYWHRNHLINCSATIRLLELSQGLPLIFASSAAVYGANPNLPHQEEMVPCPLSPYAIDKLSCEMHAKLAWELYNTPSVCFRFFNIYGPRQNPASPYSGVISKFSACLAQNTPLTIYGDGEQYRDFVYVEDVAEILVKTMASPWNGAFVYNLCTGKAISINALADLMGHISGVRVQKVYAPNRPGEIRFSCGDPTKTLNHLGLHPQTSLTQGLQSLLESGRGVNPTM
jgi:UDP-glucose 4-epimerase